MRRTIVSTHYYSVLLRTTSSYALLRHPVPRYLTLLARPSTTTRDAVTRCAATCYCARHTHRAARHYSVLPAATACCTVRCGASRRYVLRLRATSCYFVRLRTTSQRMLQRRATYYDLARHSTMQYCVSVVQLRATECYVTQLHTTLHSLLLRSCYFAVRFTTPRDFTPLITTSCDRARLTATPHYFVPPITAPCDAALLTAAQHAQSSAWQHQLVRRRTTQCYVALPRYTARPPQHHLRSACTQPSHYRCTT